MDVLFVGLSPELIASDAFPAHLATVRPGGNIPADPWDAVFVRFNDQKADVLARVCERACSTLRHGGLLVLVAQDGSTAADELVEALAPYGTAEVDRATDGARAACVRRLVPGRQDLVGLRRCLSRLSGHVDQLEASCAEVRDRAAGRAPVGERSLKDMVGHLGDLDRDGYAACIAATLEGRDHETPIDFDALIAERDHNGRPLDELVTRVRHFRYQALARLEGLGEEDWLKTGPTPDGRDATVAEAIRSWVREEHERLVEIDERLS